MGTDCQKQLTEEAKQWAQEAEERAQQQGINDRGWEEYAKEMPVIEAASENRTVELLKGNIENSIKDLPKDFFLKGSPNNVLEFDARAIPTEQECRESSRIGRELGMQSYEIANFPIIMGIKNPETLERIPGMRKTIRDEMQHLHQSKLSPWFRDAEVVDRIIVIDKNASDPVSGKSVGGATPQKKELIADKGLPRVVHVFHKDGKIPEGQKLHWVIVHEICHLNLHKGKNSSGERDFRGIFHDSHRKEWIAACHAQMDNGVVSEYAEEQLTVTSSREEAFLTSEFIAENVAAWDTNLVEICPEMQAFLDKYLS